MADAHRPVSRDAELADLLIPLERLCVQADAPEGEWTRALATRLRGDPESAIPFGRMDVRTRDFAIEVDRLGKWHEGIGQALHYAKASGLRPALALILPAEGEEQRAFRSLLIEIDRTAQANEIRLFLLKSGC